MNLDSVEQIIAITAGAGTLVASAFWFIRKRILIPIRSWVEKINRAIYQILPNGGNSMVDALKRIEKKTDENYARAKAILNLQTQAIYECDAEGRCTNANLALCEMFEMDMADVIGNGWAGALIPEDREKSVDVWMSCVTKGIPYEWHYRLKKTGLEVRTKATPMFDSKGHIIGFYGVVEYANRKAEKRIPDLDGKNHCK